MSLAPLLGELSEEDSEYSPPRTCSAAETCLLGLWEKWEELFKERCSGLVQAKLSDTCFCCLESHSAADSWVTHRDIHRHKGATKQRFTSLVFANGEFGTEGVVCYGFSLGFKF